MKILHLHWSFMLGGIETLMVNLANLHAMQGHEVTIVIVNDLIDENLVALLDKRVRFVNLRRKVGSKNPMPIVRLNLEIARTHPDVLHFHGMRFRNYVLPSLRRRYVVTQHSDISRHDIPHICRNEHIVAISQGVHDSIKRLTGRNSTVIVNGINSSQFRVSHTRYTPGERLRMVQVGRMVLSAKAHDVLVKAMRLLRDRGYDATLDFIGAGVDFDKVKRQVDELGLSDCIRLLGSRTPEYLGSHLADYHLLVQPSRFEGFGLTIAEGMAAGIPVLVSDIPTQREVVANGECGFMFATENAEDCAARIIEFIKAPDYSKIENARKRAANEYDVSVTAARYLELYRQVARR